MTEGARQAILQLVQAALAIIEEEPEFRLDDELFGSLERRWASRQCHPPGVLGKPQSG